MLGGPLHCGIAAEALAAARFAQSGFDVSVQYGANQPEYDLLVSRGNKLMRVSVKGSQDGSWIAAGSYKKESVSYAEALQNWKKHHAPSLVFCFAQFMNVPSGAMPRMYLALTGEVFDHLKKTRNAHNSLILHENHTYVRDLGAVFTDRIPDKWSFTDERASELLSLLNNGR